MKKFSLPVNCIYYSIFFACFILCGNIKSSAQNLSLPQFVIYVNPIGQGVQQGNSNYGVEIHNNSKILSGSVGSYYSINTTGAVNIFGDVHSGSTINLASYNIIKGNVTTAANGCDHNKNAFTAGNGFSLQGNLDVNSNISINKYNNSAVNGKVTHPAGTSYYGPVPSGGEVIGKPSIPTLPANAQITNFKPAGKTNITNTQTITPGAYGQIKLNGNSTITFSGAGVYIFSSISNSGDVNKFVFDFKNSSDGIFQLQIQGDADLGAFQAILKNGGSASRIYTETHGNGQSCHYGAYAWTMDNCTKDTSRWKGTIYAPYGGINIGSSTGNSNIEGALWSGTKITINNGVQVQLAAYQTCTPPNADAGDDRVLGCTGSPTVTLNGSSTTPNVQYSWKTIDSGFIVSGSNTPNPVVSKAGTYVLTVTAAGGCSATDTVVVTSSCIVPYYPPPDSGKTHDLIGSELNALFDNGNTVQDTAQNIFTLLGDSVIIDVIAVQGKHDQLLSLLQTPPYGLTDIVNNGPNSLIITGKYPVINLKKLDSLPDLINYCRPAFPPVSNTGIVNSAGDTALYSNLARNGFNLSGQGIKVGVLSNSYNTIPGNPALTDVLNGDLPGIQNPDDPVPVDVLRDYPYGQATDEGRAMLQIVHDVAPKAQLAFRTGFISAGDFAQGIRALKDDSCKVIVDDVTYITEPFFKDGVVAQAVDEVTGDGVSYFTAAGNYGNKSYANAFNPVAAPNGLTGFAHNFGGGDIYQSLSLPAGTYTIVLQWDDSTYSLNPASGGAKNDLDIYLTDNSGNILFGFNRNNLGGDPVEVMPFTVASSSQANIMIIKNAGPNQNVNFKYIIFRGEGVINEYNTGTSTIVAQANAQGAMTVGAVLYSNTPAYGVNPPTIASFSSIGGTPVNGVVRNKPDFTGPNGVNTTVYLGGVNIDNDPFPNFFGTSAAAPHLAAVAALVMEARQKFYNEQASPQEIRTLLQSTAVDMNTPGFDYTSGYGFVQADSTIRSFASPTPYISNLVLPDSTVVPGRQPFVVTVKGNYLSDSSKILFRGEPLQTTVMSNSLASATVPAFTGNPAIQVYTPPITPNKNDGGYSDSLFFFSPIKKNIIITADNKAKRYGEKIPVFTANILVDSIPLDSTNYTLHDLGLDSLFYTTPATSLSNTGIYFIRPAIPPFDPNDSADVGFSEEYNYTFNDGLLTINKLPLTITPTDTTLTYGQKIGSFNYKFAYPDSLFNDSDKAVFSDSLTRGYDSSISSQIAMADARVLVNGRPLVNSDLENLGFIASARALVNARPLVNSRPLVNVAPPPPDTTFIVDLAVESIFDYESDSATAVLVNARPLVNARALVNARPLVNGTAQVNGRPLVNGSTQVNSSSIGDSTESNVGVILDQDDVDSSNDTLSVYKPITLVTGTTTGAFTIVPAAYLTPDFDVSYNLGTLHITQATLTVKANNDTIPYGSKPVFTSIITGYQYSDDSSILENRPSYTIFNSSNVKVTDSIIPAGVYTIIPGNLSFIGDTVNYIPNYIKGTLVVNPAPLIVKANDKSAYAGSKLPIFTSTITGFVAKDSATIISGPQYTISPAYHGNPGVYSIIPSALNLKVQSNYVITYTPGTLYVNPCKLTSLIVDVRVECVETNPNNSSYKYLAHFSYINYNNTVVYIPVGNDNNIKTSGAYSGTPPQVFNPGTGYFDVYSNSLPVTWTVKSYQLGIKLTDKAVACSASPKCTYIATAQGNASATAKELPVKPEFNVYPNPAVNSVTIHVNNAIINNGTISVTDVTGKEYLPRVISRSGKDVVLDVSHLSTGVYIIRLKIDDQVQVFRILKE